jgi:hypothetical protein
VVCTVLKENALSESEVYELYENDRRPLLMLLEVLSVIKLTAASNVLVPAEVRRVTAREII